MFRIFRVFFRAEGAKKFWDVFEVSAHDIFIVWPVSAREFLDLACRPGNLSAREFKSPAATLTSGKGAHT